MSNINMQVVRKAKKEKLVEYLRSLTPTNLTKDLQKRLAYTLKGLDKAPTEVPKSTLVELIQDILESVVPTPVEALKKPLPKKKAKAEVEPEAEVEEEPEVEEPEAEEEEEKPSKKTKKQVGKKAPKKEAKVETTPDLTKVQTPLVKLFPSEFEHESLGKLVAQTGKYTSMSEFAEAIEEGKELVLCSYWSKRHLKEFEYARVFDVPVPKTGFPHDLDVLQVLYTCSGVERAYVISTYTEALFRIYPQDLEYAEVEAPDGSKFNMRYSAGMEFEVYEIVH